MGPTRSLPVDQSPISKTVLLKESESGAVLVTEACSVDLVILELAAIYTKDVELAKRSGENTRKRLLTTED